MLSKRNYDIHPKKNTEKRKESGLKIFGVMTFGVFLLFMTAGVWAEEAQETIPQTGFYLSFTPSAVVPFTVETTSPSLSAGKTKTDWGYSISGGLGYRYKDFRVEGEVMYGRSDADHITFSGGGGDLSGYYGMWGATVNFYYDIPTNTPFRPYVGAGLGGLHFEAHDITLAGGFPPTNGSNTLFTYRLMAGVSYTLSDAWRLLLGYRFMGMGQQDYETGGVSLHGDSIQTHAIQVGMQFYF
jgi:opacity protein-like surface antigen